MARGAATPSKSADQKEHGSFANFQKHIAAAKVKTTVNAGKVDVTFATGKDVLHAVYDPSSASSNTTKIFPTREVNGKWALSGAGH